MSKPELHAEQVSSDARTSTNEGTAEQPQPAAPAEPHARAESAHAEHLLRGHLAPSPRTLVDIVLATAEQYPDAPAIDDGSDDDADHEAAEETSHHANNADRDHHSGILTYAELVEEVQHLAATLNANGIGPGQRVGIRMTSGTRHLYIAILATLFAGAAYVPVDALSLIHI